MADTKDLVSAVKDQQVRIKSEYDKYLYYSGQVREIIKKAILAEFIKQETVQELTQRIIPLNIIQKIISKLAKVYLPIGPKREPVDGNDLDQESINTLEKAMEVDQHMKRANRLFKLHKHVGVEPYINTEGEPSLRILPAFSYTLISNNQLDPNIPDMVIKHVKTDCKESDQRFVVWTRENHYTIDGEGNILVDPLNPGMINPYGEIPIIIINESEDRLYPIPSDDTMFCSIAINLLLTDLFFASKYQAFSVLWAVGLDTNNLTFNPSSIINMDFGPNGETPTIGSIKPDIDVDKMLALINEVMSILLTTNNLSTSSIKTSANAADAMSFVSKMLDEATTVEDRQDQTEYFACAERNLWDLIAHKMMPFWIQSGAIDPEYAVSFSDVFELSIQFSDVKPMATDLDKVMLEKAKLDAGLTSRRAAIEALNPDFSPDKIDVLINEIDGEQKATMDALNAQNQQVMQDAQAQQPPMNQNMPQPPLAKPKNPVPPQFQKGNA